MNNEHRAPVPQPPSWKLDWDDLLARFAWLRALTGTPQEPRYHGEGDVLIHTRMVADALIALPAWRELPPQDRETLFWAALLHDVAKPACTQIAADGAISSPGHARAGALQARYILWTADGFPEPTPFTQREAIARLVRFHGLPLWLLEKADPQRAVIAASQSVRLDHVALLAEADARGRICADQGELLDRITLFRWYCEENDCLNTPYTFASDASRFVYFQKAAGDPAYAVYEPADATHCEVTLLSGLPGVGKDTWAAAHCSHQPVIALDAIRAELGVGPRDRQGAVIATARRRARELLRAGRSFTWNATNLTYTLRRSLIDLFAAYGAHITLVYLDAPRATLLRRNGSRAAPVPEAALDRMARRLEVPDLTEAHRVEWIASDSA